MKLADLFIKLGLDSKGFDDGIDKAKKKPEELTNSFQKFGKFITTALVGAFIALGAAAIASLAKIKNATDTLSTNVDILLGGIKAGADEFFRSVATWDFTNFTENMKTAIATGREYVRMLDEIESKQRSMTIAEADARAEIVSLEETLRNATLSDEERIKAGERRVQIEEELAAKRTKLAKQNYENELILATQASRLSKEKLMQIAADFDSEKKLRAERYNEIQKEIKLLEAKQAQSGASTGVLFPGMTTRTGGTNPELKQLKDELKGFDTDVINYADSLSLLGNVTDEQMNKVVDAYSKMKDAEVSGRESIKRIITTIYSLTAKKPIGDTTGAPIDILERTAESYAKLSSITDIGTFADTSGNLGKLGLEIPAGFQTESMKKMIVDEEAALAERAANWQSFKEQMAAMTIDFGIDVVDQFGMAMGEMLRTGDFPDDFGDNILAAIGGFISQLGKMLIGLGIASEAFQQLLASAFTNPVSAGLLIAAGAGLVLLGGAIKGFAKKGPSGATSGSISTPSYSGSNYGSSGARAENNTVTFEIKGDKLVGVLNNVQRKNLNMA